MSEPKKYVTFRDLKDLPAKEEKEPSNRYTSTPRTSSITSTPSTTSPTRTSRTSSSTSIPSSVNTNARKEDRDNEPKTEAPKRIRKAPKQVSPAVAPERDFQRVPNSVTRTALPDGTFRGKSKQVWDYLWSVSRGAVVPKRVVRKSRKEIKAGAGLGSMVTVDAAIEHLQRMGLLSVRPIVGSLVGNEYEVFTPEESAILETRYTSTPSTSRTTSPTQNLVQLDIPESGISSTTYLPLDAAGSKPPNTFFNTYDDDDTHTLFAGLIAALSEAAEAILDKPLPYTDKEREMWKACGCVLAEELKKAAARTETVSSVPAFFASHLRRRFAASLRNTPGSSQNSDNRQPTTERREELGAGRPEAQSQPLAHASKFSLEECRRFAEHLQQTGQGITNPGGYATTIYRTGEADALIEAFLNPESVESLDPSCCPDCRGTGYFYPEGMDRGAVARCKHPRLSNALRLEHQYHQLSQLHSGDAGYQQSDLLDDLKFRCEREKIDWDEGVINRLLEQRHSG